MLLTCSPSALNLYLLAECPTERGAEWSAAKLYAEHFLDFNNVNATVRMLVSIRQAFRSALRGETWLDDAEPGGSVAAEAEDKLDSMFFQVKKHVLADETPCCFR